MTFINNMGVSCKASDRHVIYPNELDIYISDYVWFNNDTKEVLSRYQTQMKDEIKIMEDNNYIRIYDSGNNKWLYETL